VGRVIRFAPTQCDVCQAPLTVAAGPADPKPTCHRVAELPEIRGEITAHQGHACTCPGCGSLSHAAIPAEVRAHAIGPKLAALLSYLSGRHHLTTRAVEQLAEAVLDMPLALGTVSGLEQEMSRALAAPHAEVARAVRAAAAKHADEAGWKLAGRLCWLRAALTQTAALFVEHARRGAQGLAALLGERIGGIITGDRWSAYERLPLGQRQVCWSFGCGSAAGYHFVERMPTAVQTLKLQERRVLDYLTDALAAHRTGLPAPPSYSPPSERLPRYVALTCPAWWQGHAPHRTVYRDSDVRG
jgi:transposase